VTKLVAVREAGRVGLRDGVVVAMQIDSNSFFFLPLDPMIMHKCVYNHFYMSTLAIAQSYIMISYIVRPAEKHDYECIWRYEDSDQFLRSSSAFKKERMIHYIQLIPGNRV